MLFFISFVDGVHVHPWRVRLPSLAAALRIQAVRFLLSLHRQLHKMMAAKCQFLALCLFFCHCHILLLNPLLKPRILPAKQLHLLGVRFSTSCVAAVANR